MCCMFIKRTNLLYNTIRTLLQSINHRKKTSILKYLYLLILIIITLRQNCFYHDIPYRSIIINPPPPPHTHTPIPVQLITSASRCWIPDFVIWLHFGGISASPYTISSKVLILGIRFCNSGWVIIFIHFVFSMIFLLEKMKI